MGDLVSQMLELARLDRNAALEPSETDLAEVIREVSADYGDQSRVTDRRRRARTRWSAIVDEARIRQVLVNLLANVRAHRLPKARRRTVRLAQTPAGETC